MDPNPPQALYHLVRCPGQDKELLPGLITDPQSALMFQLVAPVMSSGGSSEGASEAQLVPQCQTLSCVLGGGQATLRQHSEECQIVNINISTFTPTKNDRKKHFCLFSFRVERLRVTSST